MLGKALTKAAVQAMNEAELRTEVLIPLFREMGFRDVEHYHGGVEEQGKDIVMWLPDMVRERVTFGVVTKAGKVSGKASGKSSAAEVFFQIEQCLGSDFYDLRTLRKYPVDRCIVVASREITKEARKSLESALSRRGYDKVVDFWPGDVLWEKIEQHLPQRLVMDKLMKLHDVLRSADPHYDIIATAGTAHGVALSLREKYPGASEVAPLTVRGKFRFPDTPSAQKALRELQDHFRTGAAVKLSKEYIAEFEVPEIMKRVIGTDSIGELHIGPSAPNVTIRAVAEVIGPDQERVTVPGLEFRVLQAGTEQATLSNEHQELPWVLKVQVHWETKLMNMTFSFNLDEVNVNQVLDGLKFQRALATGDEFHIRDAASGLTFLGGPIPRGKFPAPDEAVFPLVEALVTIQQKTNTPLLFDVERITREEERTILQVSEKVRTGRFQGVGGSIGVTATRRGAELLLQEGSGGDPEQRFTVVAEGESHEILGRRIEMGPVVVVIEGMYLEEHDRQMLQEALESDPEGDRFPTSLTAPADQPFTMYYPKWLPPEERARLQPMVDQGLLPAE
jgi:hypothetical protein